MNVSELVVYIAYLIPITLSILIVYSILVAKKSVLKYTIIGYLVTCLVFDLLGTLLGKLYANNLILIPFFGLIELTWFSATYYYLTQKKFCLYLAIPTFILFIYEMFTVDFNNVQNFQTYTRFVSTLSLIILALFYCYLLLKTNWKNYNFYLFLFNATLLVYASFSCLYYLPINLLINWSSEFKFWFWLLNITITLIFYILNTKVLCNLGKTKIHS